MKENSPKKHIGIYIDPKKSKSWKELKTILPYLDCEITLIGAPESIKSCDCFCNLIEINTNGKNVKKTTLEKIYFLIQEKKTDLFLIDACPEVAAFLKYLKIPYVYTRIKSETPMQLEEKLAYEQSLFNMAFYENDREIEDYKNSAYYQKTKYKMIKESSIAAKLYCLYLQRDIYEHAGS